MLEGVFADGRISQTVW